jgi:hypothetical protein
VNTEDKDDLLGSLDERIRRISREVLVEHQTREQQSGNLSIADSADEKFAVTLRRIMAKEFVSIKETALLLNCSDGHIRNLVGKAQKGKATHPIPFLDLDGVTVFPREKLLDWAKQPSEAESSSFSGGGEGAL